MSRTSGVWRWVAALCALAGSLVTTTDGAAEAGQASPARPAQQRSDEEFAPAPVPQGAGEVLVTARADEEGYHLQVAESAGGWEWRNLATILPRGGDGAPWTGYHCVTGDQRYVVAVVAPWFASNSPEARDRGGLVYRVVIADGTVTPLASGAAVKYYNPGCGVDDRVALVTHEGADQERTRVRIVDAGDGAVAADVAVAGQLTSAVPAARPTPVVLAARDSAVVELDAAGRERVVAEAGGQPFQVRANRQGGADFLAAGTRNDADDDRVAVWSFGNGPSQPGREVGEGELGVTKLFAGRDRNVAVDAIRLDNAAIAEATSGEGGRPVAVSSAGSIVAVDVTGEPSAAHEGDAHPGSEAVDPQDVSERRLHRGDDGRPIDRPEPAPDDAVGAVPLPTAPTPPARAGATALAGPGPPTCAVPRNHLRRQAPQPNATQVNWAIQQGTRNLLKGSVLTRASNFLYMQAPQYQPSLLFPRGSLGNAPGDVPVPPSVVQAVIAQESNWKQASFRALPGVSANPTISDYYGAGGTLDRINYGGADCGYGLGQVTTGMTVADTTTYTANEKVVIAVDYAANVAASIEILVDKWNQLLGKGLKANDGDPSRLENWYMALWAYNSGLWEPDANGRWGLGWTNNPANADYPPDRDLFLRESYADAEHPNDWPYQERVLGWMETPQLDFRGDEQYEPPAYQGTQSKLRIPSRFTFCTASNNCSPTHEAGDLSYCTLADRHCFWHSPVVWAGSCATTCAGSLFTVSTTAGEPAGSTQTYPPNCNGLPPAPLDGRQHVIVDDATPALNTEGCTPSGWASQGTFTFTPGTTSDGTPLGEIDWHQLGTGFSGHTWFTKNQLAAGVAHTNTGTWTPPALSGRYAIRAHIPPSGASTPSARYLVYPGGSAAAIPVTIDQHLHENRWVSLGEFDLTSGAKVVLTNVTAETVEYTTNVAFDALAFTPVPSSGALVNVTIDAAGIFDLAQPTTAASTAIGELTLSNPNLTESFLKLYLLEMLDPLSTMSTCSGTARTSSCIPGLSKIRTTQFRDQVRNVPVATWQHYGAPDPPATLPAGFFNDPHKHKMHNSLNVRYRRFNGRIEPASVVVTYKAQSGVTDMPDFMLNLFDAMYQDYGIPKPDLRYREENLGTYTHAFSSVDPLANSGDMPGRAYRSVVTDPQVVGDCVNVHAIGGGMIGWKVALNEGGIAGAVETWKNQVALKVMTGQAPVDLYDLADGIYKYWFSNQYGVELPPKYEGSLHRMAPPIWMEHDVEVCGTGTVRPHLSPRIVTSSFMPDLYLWVNGSLVNETGAPTTGPARTGDFTHFSTDPLAGDDNPFGVCASPAFTREDMPWARAGNPWGIDVIIDGKDTGDDVQFCETRVYTAYPQPGHD